MKVLIIKTSSLGDIIHALPLLDYLHRASPGIKIGWVVEEAFKDILEGNPLLWKLHLVNTKRWRKRPFSARTRLEAATLRRELRQEGYDVVFDIQGNLKSGIIGLASGVARRIGLPRQRLQESINALFTTTKAPYRLEDTHASLRCLSSVASLPFDLDYRDLELVSDIPTSAADNGAASALLSGLKPGKKILFHSGTTWQTKFWSREGWSELGKRVCSAFPGSTILLSWGNDAEQSMAREIASRIGEDAVVIERLPLKAFAALLKQVDLVVGGDTGPVHLAAAMGTKTVSFYRSSTGSESGPRGKRHVIVQSPLPCTRCYRTSCPKDEECRASITVDAMMAGIERLLRG